MEWEDFIKQEAGLHGLSKEEEETLLAALPQLNNQINQKQLAIKFNISEATVKKRLAPIYEKFAQSCNAITQQEGAGKLKILHDEYLKVKFTQLKLGVQNIGNQSSNILRTFPKEFEPIIKDKTQSFCGRGFVFETFDKFIKSNPSGYFKVVGDAGMGKSAIAAKYILDYPETICFFNIRAEGRNRADLFLKSVRQQLMQRYNLQNVGDANLADLLTTVSERLRKDERLIIIVDALDEVDQEASGNLLYLPTILPEKVYFFLTRRPYLDHERRFNLSPSVAYQELDLRKYEQNSNDDVKEYIWLLLNDGKYQQGLKEWIEKQPHLSNKEFVEEIAVKSENNFMYLRYVLPAIADGFYNDKPLNELPQGLQRYYMDHWNLMTSRTDPLRKKKIEIVYVMCVLESAASREEIAEYSQQDDFTVQEVLDGWEQFLQKQKDDQSLLYRFYHESFRDFLHEIAKESGISLPDISAKVLQNMTKGLEL
ncbi:MAG TPA: hypothetical protein VK184_26435 [Nostocaceae cyanobacterium]|nr:hypothetical protein [Nostocaceae cyanobacterium]